MPENEIGEILEKLNPAKIVGQLPIAPPDPLGFLLWHVENEGDLFVKGDQILRKLERGELFKFE